MLFVLSSLLLTMLPAQAIDYVAPDDGQSTVPLGCGTALGNTICIFDINIAIGDTLTLGPGVTVLGSIISSTGNVTLGDNVSVSGRVFTSTGNITMGSKGNVGGRIESSTGNINLGDGVFVGINVFSTTGAITLGLNGRVTDNISSSTGPIILGENVLVEKSISSTTGPITVAPGGRIKGSVAASTGFISIGNLTQIDGSITHSEVGNITLGQSVTVAGSITTTATTINVGDLSRIYGSINNVVTGDIILQKNVQVAGDVSVITGSIDIGYQSQVGANVTATTGNIKVGDYGRVVGIATATTGDVDIGEYGQVCGYVTVTTGAVTIGAHGRVGSYVTVTTGKVALGAVTVGDYGQVNGYIAVTTGSVVFGNSGQVGSYISVVTGDTTKGAVTFGDDGRVGGAIAITTGALVTGLRFVSSDASLAMSSECAVFVPPPSVSSIAASFECLETGTNASWSATARKALYTKLVGANFAFDIAALATDGSLKSDYAATTRYVKVALFQDSATPSSCGQFASQSPVASQTVAFSSGAVSGAAGRTLSGTFNLGSAYKLLRCRVTECTDSTCGSATALAPSCSSDQFAVRPSAVTLVTTATATAPLATSTPVVKAGVAFTLRATTSAGSSYAGNLTHDAGKLTAQTPAQDTSIQSGGATGALNPVTLIANATAINATYDEAGYVYLAPGAYRDDTFAAVDSAMGDCHTTTANDLYLADTLVGGKYGCSIGNTSTVSLGRFIPDHFVITAASVVNRSQLASVAACSASPFGYMSEPMRVRFTLNATNLLGGLTTNYQGVFAKLATTDWLATGNNSIGVRMTAKGFKPTPTSVDSCGVAFDPLTPFATTFACTNGVTKAPVMSSTGARVGVVGTPAAPLWSGGSSAMAATLLFKRADVADGPYALSIGIAPQDSEGVIAAYDLDTNNDNGNDHVALGTTQARHGRLSISNNYGSDLLRLSVPIQAQYWNGSAYVINADDSCTPITASSFTVTQGRGAPITTAILAGAVLTGGNSNKTFVLGKPSNTTSGIGSVIVRTSATAPVDTPLNTYLPGVGTETFGLYKGGVVIYGRELY